jgi:hypothetical protein
MAYESILPLFRLVAKELDSVSDMDVVQWIDLTTPLVSSKRYRTLYHQAIALLTAHRMKLAGIGMDAASTATINSIDASMGGKRVSSYSEGETSVSFDTSMPVFTDSKAYYTQTPYGAQYLGLRQSVIIPIISAGEGNGGA